ncbi:hypothetical protein PENTCL1PPCAC_20049, partial [Pristionchus entomophagus]
GEFLIDFSDGGLQFVELLLQLPKTLFRLNIDVHCEVERAEMLEGSHRLLLLYLVAARRLRLLLLTNVLLAILLQCDSLDGRLDTLLLYFTQLILVLLEEL